MRRAGFMFIELLLVVAIIMFLFFQVLKAYFKNPSIDKETRKFISEQGIDAANYKAIADTARKQIQELGSRYEEQLKQLDEAK